MRKPPIYAVLCIGWRLLFGKKSIAFSFRYLLFYRVDATIMLKWNSMNCNSTILEARYVYWPWERTGAFTARLYWKSSNGLWQTSSWQDHPDSESTEIEQLSDGLLWVPERYNARQHQRVCAGIGPGKNPTCAIEFWYLAGCVRISECSAGENRCRHWWIPLSQSYERLRNCRFHLPKHHW